MNSEMENRDWLNDYVSLKQVNPANPFMVPDGYFEGLSDRIVSIKNLHGLTYGGFEGGFTVPEQYFGELENNIQARAALESLNIEEGGFTVPAGYFDELQERIQSRILVEEALGRAGELTVPQGYFNELNKNILAKTTGRDLNRTAVVKKLYNSTAFKYATAACFALVLGGGILLSELNSSVKEHKNSFLHKQLSTVPLDEIKSYLQLNQDAGDTQQGVINEGAPVDDKSLNDALQKDIDSVQ